MDIVTSSSFQDLLKEYERASSLFTDAKGKVMI